VFAFFVVRCSEAVLFTLAEPHGYVSEAYLRRGMHLKWARKTVCLYLSELLDELVLHVVPAQNW